MKKTKILSVLLLASGGVAILSFFYRMPSEKVEVLSVKSEGFPIDIQKSFGLSFASEILADGNVYAGVLRSTDNFLCSTCNIDSDFQEKHAYIWVLGRKPIRLSVTKGKATIMCEGKNEKLYYVFAVNKNVLNGVDEINVTPD